MPDAVPFSLPFDEAIAFFQQKGFKISPASWRDVWQQEHARAFTVARVTAMDVLQDIRAEVDKAITSGVSLDEFKKNLIPMLERKGWWAPKGEEAKTLMPDGTIRKRLQPWRLETIYRTNIQTAYATGRYQQQTEVATDRPYWQYKAIMDSRTRPAHAAMNGRVYPFNDPVWKSWYPPNGFHCRCYVKTLSNGDMQARGLTPSIDPTGFEPDEGWRYNVGEAGMDAWQPKLDKYDPHLASRFVKDQLKSSAFERFFEGKVKGEFPVGILSEELKAAISAETSTVVMSSPTLKKNIAHHPELGIEDYRLVQDILTDAQLIVQDGDRTLVFFRSSEKVWFAAVKSTQSGRTLFLTSLRYASLDDVEEVKKKGKILRDRF
jgi:SPP1 gp7 family putative phage head morphogenesis protein